MNMQKVNATDEESTQVEQILKTIQISMILQDDSYHFSPVSNQTITNFGFLLPLRNRRKANVIKYGPITVKSTRTLHTEHLKEL